jgi:hypothetical protein
MDKLASCSFQYREEKQSQQESDLWRPDWIRDDTPAAVRIEMVPLEADPSRIQVPVVVAPFRPTRRAMQEITEDD